ncbi:neutral/alkaline non-lysosomal ceramidase N-terminal domain-containing protein [Parvibaculaceae bacterium PLY_AMNH_Bact1]|nr:neutral/alkaline non-lysosomal ceramidase N-terminal domain-containing protein [Parvibaculaceae bacterium PLY_AMNH_Bact1]
MNHLIAKFLMTVLLVVGAAEAKAKAAEYLIGRGMTDITGPAFGIQMWGFGREDQLTEGLHIRQRARAFIIAEPNDGKRLVFVSADIGSIEHNITLEVLDRLKARYHDLYTLENVILSATHTHAGVGGHWHTRVELGLAGAFYPERFERIVEGIVAAIVAAHNDLQSGDILINKGDVDGAGANRSMAAYDQNPAEERARYPEAMDKEMTLLSFIGADGPIGIVNWFAVHPTSMTYDNKLISGDHKGYASLAFEKEMGVRYESKDDFVAAFAQSTPGDITPNLNLNNTGPGKGDFESTAIIGSRQLAVARDLFETAEEPLSGPIDYRQLYVDLSGLDVSGEFTGAGTQTTCPSAYGYSFAGGSTEDGGGHFLFEEGMTQSRFYLDFLIAFLTGAPKPTPAVVDCQAPKPILFETGTGEPPLQSQIRSIGLARIGQLVILTVPAEVTTMAARRLKETVRVELGGWLSHVVIAGYVNGYAGYVTTPEEYLVQQYEGGHTLHGQWTLPAYRQTAATLARAMEAGQSISNAVVYDDWRAKAPETALHDGSADGMSEGAEFGDALPLTQAIFKPGEEVLVEFRSANPTADHGALSTFVEIERQQDGSWQKIATDGDWETKIRWQEGDKEDQLVAQIIWETRDTLTAGTYRVRHFGSATLPSGDQKRFEGTSASFQVGK